MLSNKLSQELKEEENLEYVQKLSDRSISRKIISSNNNHKLFSAANQSMAINTPLQLEWRKLTIQASVQIEENINGRKKKTKFMKPILNSLSGILHPYSLTAIIGPSGSGKTTLLNFLSGRLFSENLKITGELFLNQKNITDIEQFSNQIAYVMQDDILLTTFTPRESFEFVLKLKKHNLSDSQRELAINNLINELGIQKCADTIIGGGFVKGISGGEKKRTSIGIELLTDPKILFLDEPTTGLDSSTSLQVINILRKLSQKGMNVIATIHQPSTDLFYNFDNLLLLVQGNIIYQGKTEDSVDYFTKVGFECPESYNPCDYFMKMMNEQGLMMDQMILEGASSNQLNEQSFHDKFQERVQLLVQQYQKQDKSQYYEQFISEEPPQVISGYKQTPFIVQFAVIFKRFIINIKRTKLSLKLQIIQFVVLTFLYILAYYNLRNINAETQTQSYLLNMRGAIFFMVNTFSFQSITSSILAFNTQKNLYIREKATNLYGTSAFFWGKNISELPMQILFPCIFVIINYFIIGLPIDATKFFITILTMALVAWHGTAYGFLISVLVPKFEVAFALIPIVVVPLLLLSGLFEQENNMPIYWTIISYFSLFKFGYQALSLNLIEEKYVTKFYVNSIWYNLLILFAYGVIFRFFCVFGLYFVANPKRPKLTKADDLRDQEIIKSSVSQLA